MQQFNKYIITDLGTENVNILTQQDANLVEAFQITNIPFYVGKYELNLSFYDLNQNYIETFSNIESYSVLGKNQGNGVTELGVNPVQDCLDRGYFGDVILKYEAVNNLFSKSNELNVDSNLYIVDISIDRTEIRAKALKLVDSQVSTFVDATRRRLLEGTYFPEIYLDFFQTKDKSTITNIVLETIGTEKYITIKLYQPLPTNIIVKDQFYIREKIGDAKVFKVVRDVEILPEAIPQLSSPNFNIDTEEYTAGVTEYVGYGELLSYPLTTAGTQLQSICQEKGIELSIDYSSFSNFIQFSSAVERLENFRYKLTLIESYREAAEKVVSVANVKKYELLIQGIIQNFDHYERFLYFENSEKSWPKVDSIKPYTNENTESAAAIGWWKKNISEAKNYDENNASILINSIPLAIREDTSNEPYIIFVHMIGQHFDNEWVYIKALSSRYDGDNRLDRGLPKDLVLKAISSFGLEICKSNSNLEELFNRCGLDGSYNKGDETAVTNFKQISSREIIGVLRTFDGKYAPLETIVNTLDGTKAFVESYIRRFDGEYAGKISKLSSNWQPVLVDNYRKEIYKRIYHNIPVLLKTKGTSRGLRTLINCFGIPDNILTISFQKNVTGSSENQYFGPEAETNSNLEKVIIKDKDTILPFDYRDGTFRYVNQLDENTSVISNIRDSRNENNNLINIGFDITKQFDTYVQSSLPNFDYDSIVGDSRNEEENYGNAFDFYISEILQRAAKEGVSFRSPSGIIRLVRYIDTTLYRSIRDFISARDKVAVGVVVKDNILHRNRYSGLRQSAKSTEQLEGTLNGLCIASGSSGDAFKVTEKVISKAGRNINTVSEMNYTQVWSTEKETGTKDITDGSARYNGEIQGAERKVTDGNLIKNNLWHNQVYEGNPYTNAGYSTINYQVQFNFLCLPSIPSKMFTFEASNVAKQVKVYCTINNGSSILDYNYCRDYKVYGIVDDPTQLNPNKVYTAGNSSEKDERLIIGNATSTIFDRFSAKPLAIGTGESAFMYRKIQQLELNAESEVKGKVFMGWYKGNISENNTEYLSERFMCAGEKLVIEYNTEHSELEGGYTARYANSDSLNYQPLSLDILENTEDSFKFKVISRFPSYYRIVSGLSKESTMLKVTVTDKSVNYTRVFVAYFKQDDNLEWESWIFSAPQFCNTPRGSTFTVEIINTEELPKMKYAYLDGIPCEVNWNN